MVRNMNLAAVALALAAGTFLSGAAESRISFNTIKFNRISLNGIAANGDARVHQTTATPAKGATSAPRKPGAGSVSSIVFVKLPAK
jgi:hypothetical protein